MMGFELTTPEIKRAHSLIELILKVESFAELYELLGFEYVVEKLRQHEAIRCQFVSAGGEWWRASSTWTGMRSPV